MFIIPAITAEDGSISAAEPAPIDAICTVTTPDGCTVYMPGDELPVFEVDIQQGAE